MSAVSASATSGTWAGCTTRCSTCGKDPIHRKHHHGSLTFGLLYAFTENFILPLSHDEVAHGKGSLLAKMPGDRWQKFANLRSYLTFMYTMPGKKLLFMGGEFAQEREWNHDIGLDWHLLDDPMHAGVQSPRARFEPFIPQHSGAARVGLRAGRICNGSIATTREQSVISYIRRGKDRNQFVVIVCNFTPVVRRNYRIGVPRGGLLSRAAKHRFGGIWRQRRRKCSVAALPKQCLVMTSHSRWR